MKRNFLSVLFLMIVCSLQAQTSSSVARAAKPAGISSERLTRIDNFIQSYIDKGKLNGASAIIRLNGKIIYYKSFGFANKEKNIAMKNDNIFRIASMTKPIISVAVMMLYEEGKFLLDDPDSKFIPEFKSRRIYILVIG